MEAAISMKIIYKRCCHVLSSILQIILFSEETVNKTDHTQMRERNPSFGLSNLNATHSSYPYKFQISINLSQVNPANYDF